jgi:hypothetical protein
MSDSTVKLLMAFGMGVGISAGVIELVHRLPFPKYFKTILSIVLPLPPVAIALVMTAYGPELPASTGPSMISPVSIARAFFFGAAAGLIVVLILFMQRRKRPNRNI